MIAHFRFISRGREREKNSGTTFLSLTVFFIPLGALRVRHGKKLRHIHQFEVRSKENERERRNKESEGVYTVVEGIEIRVAENGIKSSEKKKNEEKALD